MYCYSNLDAIYAKGLCSTYWANEIFFMDILAGTFNKLVKWKGSEKTNKM